MPDRRVCHGFCGKHFSTDLCWDKRSRDHDLKFFRKAKTGSVFVDLGSKADFLWLHASFPKARWLLSTRALLPWFVATRVRLRGTDVSVVWDAYGTRLGHGKGLHVWFGDRPVGSLAPLPATNGADGMPLPPRARVAWDGGSLSIIE